MMRYTPGNNLGLSALAAAPRRVVSCKKQQALRIRRRALLTGSIMVFRSSDREVVRSGSFAFAFLAVVLATGALFTAASKESATGSASPSGPSVTLDEFRISPDVINVAVNGTLTVSNRGKVSHNLSIEGTDLKTANLAPAASGTFSVKGLKDGRYTVLCSISGHKEAGMRGVLTVGSGGPEGAAGSGSTGRTADELTAMNTDMDATMQKPVDAYVGQLKGVVDHLTTTGKLDGSLYKANTSYGSMKTNPLGGPAVLEPKILADGTKEFDLTAQVTQWEVEPGKTVSAWTYNGMVPGPTIKVNPGDKVRIHLVNYLPESTAVHFHGVDVPVAMDGVPGITQNAVNPGATFDYDFTITKRAAVGMYHSHHHAESQVADGLAGAFIVGDLPAQAIMGKATPDLRLPMMLNDAGSIGLSLNGKSFPATAPIVAVAGQWVQIDYMNEGQLAHPMHLHGIPQVVIAKDGYPLAQPYTADTITVGPGERYSVLVHPLAEHLGKAKDGSPALGIWAFHCHILSHAESARGMFGMVTTFIVVPPSAV